MLLMLMHNFPALAAKGSKNISLSICSNATLSNLQMDTRNVLPRSLHNSIPACCQTVSSQQQTHNVRQ